MKTLIKYHEKTPEEDQLINLDLEKHIQIEALNGNHVNLDNYDGELFYGKFIGYSRVDDFSYFELDTLQIDRGNKINQLLNS
jgi:hypothetical protein